MIIIELRRAWTPSDMQESTCGVCGHRIPPRSILASAVTDDREHMNQACEECVAYLGSRNPEKSPTREEYEEALRRYPQPMYPSDEALVAVAEGAGYVDPTDLVYDESWIWRAPRSQASPWLRQEEDVIHITPTVLYRIDQGGERLTVAVVEKPEKGRALIVFRSEEEAEKYRQETDKHREEGGLKPVSVDVEDLANLVEMHGCTHVAMPEPWTGKGGVDFFAAGDFIEML